jgi:site-specific recombinase XerD
MKKATKESYFIAYTINEWLNSYLPSQQIRSNHTTKAYKDTLSLYILFLEADKKITSSTLSKECFSDKVIEEWLLWLINERNCSTKTCNNRLASMRSFLKYIGRKDISYQYIYLAATQIPRKKEIPTKVKGLSKKAIQALLTAPDQTTKTGRRDLTFFILMYNTATRIDELLSLKIKQLCLETDKPYITVIGKRTKIRTLYLLPRTVEHLKRYLLEVYGKNPDEDAYVFYSRNKGIYGKLTQPAISKQLKKYAYISHQICEAVPLDLHAHQLRHAKASHWLEDGMNIVQISFLLGHAQLQTTMMYLDITIEQEANALATLEDENSVVVSRKWKTSNSLKDFCGLY